MTKRDNSLKLNSVSECNDYMGVETSHPHISVVDYTNTNYTIHRPKQINVYAITCYWNYIRSDKCVIRFFAPGATDIYVHDAHDATHGWTVVFDGELLVDTLLDNRLREFPFFTSHDDNGIVINHEECEMVINCMRSIDRELKNTNDRFSSRILASGIAVLLNICMRYYERQHLTHSDSGDIIVDKLNKLLNDYVSGQRTSFSEMPTVASLAEALHISPNYLGDVVRKKLLVSAQQHIHHTIVKEAARQLRHTKRPIGEIGYNLGFKYPHHFTRVFKKEIGLTPNEFRRLSNNVSL